MASGNTNLERAKKVKDDEFYTRLEDIEFELAHYKQHFKGKTVLCNCDDPRVSNFFTYFSYNFAELGLKRLITTCYKNQERDLFSQNNSERAIWLEYTGTKNGNSIPSPEEIGIRHLEGDGDFRSAECVELLKQADIVVTNPPFSLFREYVAQLMQHDKKFLIIGSQNAVKYKEIFPLFMENKIWLGHGFRGGNAYFSKGKTYSRVFANGVFDETTGLVKFRNVGWYTNLDLRKRHENIPLYKTYTEEEYPSYVNYDGIEVSKIADIPCDYYGLMGVPITFMLRYNPEQFEIVGMSLDLADMNVIKKRLGHNDGGPTFYLDHNGKLERLYDRIVIRRRQSAKSA